MFLKTAVLVLTRTLTRSLKAASETPLVKYEELILSNVAHNDAANKFKFLVFQREMDQHKKITHC